MPGCASAPYPQVLPSPLELRGTKTSVYVNGIDYVFPPPLKPRGTKTYGLPVRVGK